MLPKMLRIMMPTKNSTSESVSCCDIRASLKSIYPAARLNNAHITLTVGEDSPIPLGLANGVGNLSPHTPLTKCGTKFARNIPDNRAAR